MRERRSLLKNVLTFSVNMAVSFAWHHAQYLMWHVRCVKADISHAPDNPRANHMGHSSAGPLTNPDVFLVFHS